MPIDVDSLVSQHFAGISPSNSPTLTLFVGPIASGKSRFRRTFHPGECVQLDAADLFNALGGPDSPDFPGELVSPMNEAGQKIADRAIAERFNLVAESSGDQRAVITPIAQRMKQLGYRVELVAVNVDIDKSIAFNESRGPDNISSYFAQEYHLGWLAEAVDRALVE